MTALMRVHYEIPDELHQRAKVAAAQTGVSLKAFLEMALDRAAATVEAEQARKPRKKK